MRCRNTTDGPGDFDCLYGFPCDSVSGQCDCLGSPWFVHDTALFVIPNCGLPIVAIAITYCMAALGGIVSCVFSLSTAYGRKRATQHFLWVGAIWTALLAVLQPIHYYEGRQFGTATIIWFYLTIQVVNVQVIMFSFQIFSLLALLAKPVVIVRLRSFMLKWLKLWSFFKIAPAILLLVGHLLPNDDMFNGVILAWAVLIVAEVGINTTGQYLGIKRLIRELEKIPTDQADSTYFRSEKVVAVLEFSERLRNVLPMASAYAIIVWVLIFVLLGLYTKFGFAIPHAWIWYMLMVLSWPLLALECVMLSRDATVKKIERLAPTLPTEKTFSLFDDRGRDIRRKDVGPTPPPISRDKPGMVAMAVEANPQETPAPIIAGSPSFSNLLKSTSDSDLATNATMNPVYSPTGVTPTTISTMSRAMNNSGRTPTDARIFIDEEID